MEISLIKIANILKTKNNFCILTHQYPDGDTLGSAFALCKALQNLGKAAKVLDSENVPNKYSFLKHNVENQIFNPEYIISVDIADKKLIPSLFENFASKIDLCIDHHKTNKNFAKLNYVDSSAAATSEIIFELLNLINTEIDVDIANCLYTGIATDTGCFKYSSTTARTHKIAAKLIEYGAKAAQINRDVFEIKTIEQFTAEKLIFNSTEFYFKNKVAAMFVTFNILKKSNADDSLIDGIAGMPLRIKGVLIGLTFRQKEDHLYKVSVRTVKGINAAEICSYFEGGGHVNAAGCTVNGNLNEVKEKLLNCIKNYL